MRALTSSEMRSVPGSEAPSLDSLPHEAVQLHDVAGVLVGSSRFAPAPTCATMESPRD